MICRLCGVRKTRRACPALGHDICAKCCGTKRLTEISCPSDCPHLATAREHPAAAVVRRRQLDVGVLLPFVRDFTAEQSEIFVRLGSYLAHYKGTALETLLDEDVVGATTALAATLDTASRGVIYEHRPPSLPAERLATSLKTLLRELEEKRGSSRGFDRDVSTVLRRLAGAAGQIRSVEPSNPRALLDTLGRLLAPAGESDASVSEPRLIVP